MPVANFIRVRKTDPCPICGKPDWCMISSDREVALCARVQTGSFKKTSGGWCHRLTVRRGMMNFGAAHVRRRRDRGRLFFPWGKQGTLEKSNMKL